MATNRPTTKELADSIAVIEERTAELLQALDSVQTAASIENDKMWTALRGVAGLDGVATGIADVGESMSSGASDIREAILKNARRIRGGIRDGADEIQAVLAPLRLLVPPTSALPLEPGVAGALTVIRVALGGVRDTNFSGMTTDFDGPVDFIGQADPSLDPPDPGPYPGPNPGPFPPDYHPGPYDGPVVDVLSDEEDLS